MLQLESRRLAIAGRRAADTASIPQVVLGTGVVMVFAQLIFRAWALYPSWFLADDYRLMLDAKDRELDKSYLLESFDSHLMPLARALVWVVTQSGPMNWTLAATLTLVLQLAAGIACLWMLASLFTARWLILAPLALYLTSAVSMPAFMWWAAAVNQLAYQVTFFCSVALWVSYLRSRKLVHLAATLVAVVVGIGFYEKALIVGLPLAFLALGYFASGSLRARVVHVSRTYWPALAAGLLVAGGYLYYYLNEVPRPFESSVTGTIVADDIANSMLGAALPTGLLGGPWRWWDTSSPTVLASAPDWAVHLSWAVIVVVVLYSVLRRTRVMRGWLLLAAYALVLWAVLTVSRGQIFGSIAGIEYRYATDAVCVLALVLGLVFAELKGAVESAEERTAPLLTWRAGPAVVAVLTGAVVVGGLVSSYKYVQFWRHDNASDAYVHALRNSLAAHQGPADLPAQVLPPQVMPPYSEPDNQSPAFLRLLDTRARFPDSSDNLMVIDGNGEVVPALVNAVTTSTSGPVADCGWLVTDAATTIPLAARTEDGPWWMRIGYLSGAESPLTLTFGDRTVETEVQKGLGAVFASAPGTYDAVTVGGLAPGTTLCVDVIQVGDPVAARSIP